MPNHNSLIKLNTFFKEYLFWLQVISNASFLQLNHEFLVIQLREFDAREQIASDTVEEGNII
jgi:hypothetical protein